MPAVEGPTSGEVFEQAPPTTEPAGTAGADQPNSPAGGAGADAPQSPNNDAAVNIDCGPTPDELNDLVAEVEHNVNAEPSQSQSKMMSSTTQSLPALGTYSDLKKKTEFAATTVDGVLKRTTFMSATSNFAGSPKYTIAQRGPSSFIRSSSTPAPGSYTLNSEGGKYKTSTKYSFGGCSRFGLGQSPAKKQPGPGAYNPRDPSDVQVKVGFGGSTRGKGQPQSTHNPGPGAYENRSSMGQGKMFTAGGRHPVSYMRARSQPGPGAYNPVDSQVAGGSMKVGFGTSTRSDIASASRNLVAPGPGSYDMQNKLAVGADASKYSITSRRRLHDLNSYVSPGPGSYNAHTTSFGE